VITKVPVAVAKSDGKRVRKIVLMTGHPQSVITATQEEKQKSRTGNAQHYDSTYSQMVLVNIADMAPAQAANVVLTAAKAATSPRLALLTLRVEPGLKPYHPNHNANVPKNFQHNKSRRNRMLSVEI
jgi:hypothetical protein